MLKLGLIGCGAIGGAVASALLDEEVPGVRLAGILDIAVNEIIVRAQHDNIPLVQHIEELLDLGPDLVLEAAGHQALIAHGRSVVSAGIDLLPMSVGALADPALRDDLAALANRTGATIYISSGAIGCLDVLRAGHAQGGLEEVVLTSAKRPAALAGQPYLVEHGINVDALDAPLTVFDGSATEACLTFPKSTNIAASVSLAGLGFDETRVRVVADPEIPRTTHTLQIKGGFGEAQLTLRNLPHPDNPSTTYLACLGAIAALNNVQAMLRFV
jgi:aspartate dehydrogenase